MQLLFINLIFFYNFIFNIKIIYYMLTFFCAVIRVLNIRFQK